MKPRSGVRPTTRKVLEAVFAILDGMLAKWEGLRVLDAFAGQGQLGLLALEHGAAHVQFVEKDAAVAADLKRQTGRRTDVAVQRGDTRDVLSRLVGPFDLVFVDPPYSAGLAAAAVALLGTRRLVAADGVVVVEHHHKDVMPEAEASGNLRPVRQQRYGETAVTFYRPISEVEASV